MPKPTIRPYREADYADLRAAFIELQETEHALHDGRLPGEPIADAYLAWLHREVAAYRGAIFIAEAAGVFQGFVACWVVRHTNIIETRDSNTFGLVSDICVLPAWRGRGIAGDLLAAAETHLADQGVTRVRIGALAKNDPALAAYRKRGFAPYEVVLEKRVTSPKR
ncbi:MAG: GNAT family N-acetyltransferase [Proteobacteria bacterium]|nr:GNAT family N-acetyltransferase [Pseudomonadota bacterium]